MMKRSGVIKNPLSKRSAVALITALLLSSCGPMLPVQRDSLPTSPTPALSVPSRDVDASVTVYAPNGDTATNSRSMGEPKEKPYAPPAAIAAGVRMDFNGVDVQEFVQVISDSLGLNYVIDPSVSGKVTVHTGQTLSGPELFAAFREILQVQGLDIRHEGTLTVVYPVKGVRKRYDLGGLHVRLLSVSNAPVSTLVSELQQALAAVDPEREAVSVVPLDRLQSVMLLARDASMVETVSRWVRDLDTVPDDAQQNIYLYHVRSGLASNLAALVNSLLYANPAAGLPSSGTVPAFSTSPGIDPQAPSAMPAPTMPTSSAPGRITPTIIPDDSGNVLLIRSNAGEHSRIVKVVEQLDVVPRQVLIDVLVAEVTLGDSLGFGVEWALRNNQIKIGNSKLNPTGVTSFAGVNPVAAGGFAFTVLNAAADPVAVLNALASQTDVSLISSPQIFVQNNREAMVNVGDRVPVVTSETERTGTDNPITDKTVQYYDTGTILKVTPRIHFDGVVSLEVSQQVSQAIANQTSAINSPVIQTREVKTSLSVRDGQPVMLGGLISRGHTSTGNKVPLLGDLPGIGWLFRYDGTENKRTELLVMITPHVVYADSLDAFTSNYKSAANNIQGRLHDAISRGDRPSAFAR